MGGALESFCHTHLRNPWNMTHVPSLSKFMTFYGFRHSHPPPPLTHRIVTPVQYVQSLSCTVLTVWVSLLALINNLWVNGIKMKYFPCLFFRCAHPRRHWCAGGEHRQHLRGQHGEDFLTACHRGEDRNARCHNKSPKIKNSKDKT